LISWFEMRFCASANVNDAMIIHLFSVIPDTIGGAEK